MDKLLAGYAETDFTPEPGLTLQGQHFRRVAERTRDPLMAVASAFRSGLETVVLVSVDVCFFPTELAKRTQAGFERRTGLPGERLLVSATHSHVAPHTTANHWGEVDPAFVERLCEAVVESAARAIARLEPVTVFSGTGTLDNLGWNRRAMFADGTSAMHGKSNRPDFVGSEGPRDPTLAVVFTRGEHGRVTGAMVNFATHPNSVECELYYSADIPGEVRRLLKQMLGNDVTAQYFTGAAGNVTPLILEPFTDDQPWMGEEGLWRSGLYIAGEAAKVIASTVKPAGGTGVRLAREEVLVPIRPYPQPGDVNYPGLVTEESAQHYAEQEARWADRIREHSPVEVRLNVVRIADTAICTNPAELFVEFGLRIRETSPARVTLISELTDGYVGYVPTRLAFERGGYETWPSFTSQLAPEAGDIIVDTTTRLLNSVFD